MENARGPSPWAIPAEQVAIAHGTDPQQGLTNADACARLASHGPNRVDLGAREPAWRQLLAQFADPLVYLLGAAIAISLVVWVLEGANGAPTEVIVIGSIVVANGLLGYWQQQRAEKAVAALQRLASPFAAALRDGQVVRLPAAEIVTGDVLVLSEGDAVVADARVIDHAALSVAEASLTGESEPVAKTSSPLPTDTPLADRTNMVFAGTAVTRGHGRAVVTATATATELGQIARLLTETKDDDTPLQREVERIGRVLGLAVVLIAATVMATIFLTAEISEGSDIVDVLIIGISLAVAAVPEGLPAIMSVVLALGIERMARANAIVKRLASVETLGSATVICTDKTGTLTKNEMTITRVVTGLGQIDLTGAGHSPEGALCIDRPDAEASNGTDRSPLESAAEVIAAGCLASNATLTEENGRWEVVGDPTEAAFVIAEAKIAGLADRRMQRFSRIGEIPFTSERKLMSTLQHDREKGRHIVVTKGSPDALLERCCAVRFGSIALALTAERRAAIDQSVDDLADAALRTISVAYRVLEDSDDLVLSDALERDLVYLGTVGMIDPPRAEAREAIREAHDARVRVIMITGDHPRTGARIAADLGIADPDTPALSGAALDQLDEAQLRSAAAQINVFARVTPAHKLRIVEALHAQGEVVAMTGDGVNDAPALKAADIGVAMGIAGTDVAKEAADMILVDDNFATIVAAMREGRAIYANIRSFLRFLLSSNTGEVLTMFLGVMLARVIGLDAADGAIAVPLLATQILWINLLTDFAPALALGLDPPLDGTMRQPPRAPNQRAIDRHMLSGILWVSLVMAAACLFAFDLGFSGGLVEGDGTVEHARTMAFTTLVLAQLFNCLNSRSDHVSAFTGMFANRWLWAALGLSLSLQIGVVHLPVLHRAFDTVPLTAGDWIRCAALASAVLWAAEATKLFRRRRSANDQGP